MAVKNLYSLGLLRNGKVYQTKQLAIQGLTQVATNDGVAKLARYLDPVENGDPIIRTLVGFYANALEMEDADGGQSSYTILDVDGNAAEIDEIKDSIAEINNTIGEGIQGTTLTAAINDINDRLGSGFTSAHTVADTLAELKAELINKLTITLDIAGEPTSGYLRTYELKQGGELVGKIDIPKDMVVSGGSLVHGTWIDDNNFIEDPDGPDTAIKLEFANADVIYINTKDLVDFYTAGDGIQIDNTRNTIAIKRDDASEDFLIVDTDGIKVLGIQAAIDAKADAERLYADNGISIVSNRVKAVAARFSSEGINNPIKVDEDGIKLDKELDCGFFDAKTAIAKTDGDIDTIENPEETEVFINGNNALDALTSPKSFKVIEVSNVEADEQIYLNASEYIVLDSVDVTGDKGSTNGYFLYDSPIVEVSNINIVNGAEPYNVFEGQGDKLESFIATNVTVDDVALKHNVFNIYTPKNDAVIKISDSKFNLDVNNSNVLRLSNCNNATGVTVEFENVEWTYENTPNIAAADFNWAGLIIYQPYGNDIAYKTGSLTPMSTWRFAFKNCKYNGVKVTENNFGEHNQVFYMYSVKNLPTISNPEDNGLNLTFE